ncbi:hypothetical protein JOC86_000496 [Bacillus pakistanensis]|uniref:Polymerase nucleotidyl transferase domain-containing protein n=1 Tax=Rossellomorea pakistanensis TaxID=992288 RepID=A0ABS2N814_9BACI|nr:hypothetical protein [Bacillus pakistanensis]MBM7583959.1 hypothetical protein [Bacillus pakistanensis]
MIALTKHLGVNFINRIPKNVYDLINDYINLWKDRLPNTLAGFYLHGLIVLDAYINDSSDIDFVAITKNRLTIELTGARAKIIPRIGSLIIHRFYLLALISNIEDL